MVKLDLLITWIDKQYTDIDKYLMFKSYIWFFKIIQRWV